MTQRQHVIEDIANRIVGVDRPHPVRVAIDGVDAAGKTTVADDLAPAIRSLGREVVRASIDGFHNPAAVRRQRGALSPEGYFHDSFNYPALIQTLLEPFGPGGSRWFRRAVFDFRTDAPVGDVDEHAAPTAVLLLDGVFLLRPELRDHFDFSVFVRADFAITVKRAELRDALLFGSVDEVRQRYQERYVPGQRLYLASAEPERFASIVVDNNDPERPHVESAVSRCGGEYEAYGSDGAGRHDGGVGWGCPTSAGHRVSSAD